jgi:hypothetical protein
MSATGRTRVIRKVVPTESFFNFFKPPQPPTPEQMEQSDLDEEELETLDARLEEDYQIGEELKEKIIPRAIDYFTGKALKYEDFDDEELEEYEEGEFDDEDDEDDEVCFCRLNNDWRKIRVLTLIQVSRKLYPQMLLRLLAVNKSASNSERRLTSLHLGPCPRVNPNYTSRMSVYLHCQSIQIPILNSIAHSWHRHFGR